MARRLCLEAGCTGLVEAPASRCVAHKRPHGTALRPDRELRRGREAVAAWRAEHGERCPGYGDEPAHMTGPDNPLTADHTVAVIEGGSGGPLAVLCRRCNSRRGGELGARRRFGPKKTHTPW